MHDKIHDVVSICLLFHVLGALTLTTAIRSAIQDYRQFGSIDKETVDILILSPTWTAFFTVPIFLIAGDELVSILTVMMIIDAIVCTLGWQLKPSH